MVRGNGSAGRPAVLDLVRGIKEQVLEATGKAREAVRTLFAPRPDSANMPVVMEEEAPAEPDGDDYDALDHVLGNDTVPLLRWREADARRNMAARLSTMLDQAQDDRDAELLGLVQDSGLGGIFDSFTDLEDAVGQMVAYIQEQGDRAEAAATEGGGLGDVATMHTFLDQQRVPRDVEGRRMDIHQRVAFVAREFRVLQKEAAAAHSTLTERGVATTDVGGRTLGVASRVNTLAESERRLAALVERWSGVRRRLAEYESIGSTAEIRLRLQTMREALDAAAERELDEDSLDQMHAAMDRVGVPEFGGDLYARVTSLAARASRHAVRVGVDASDVAEAMHKVLDEAGYLHVDLHEPRSLADAAARIQATARRWGQREVRDAHAALDEAGVPRGHRPAPGLAFTDLTVAERVRGLDLLANVGRGVVQVLAAVDAGGGFAERAAEPVSETDDVDAAAYMAAYDQGTPMAEGGLLGVVPASDLEVVGVTDPGTTAREARPHSDVPRHRAETARPPTREDD